MALIERTFETEFMYRLRWEWLPAYCSDPERMYAVEGFDLGKDLLAEADAHDFLQAIDHGVATFGPRQRLCMKLGKHSETLFWEGRKNIQPRTISLWLETVLTVAAGGRLHLDYGWPTAALGMQSKDDAFDLMAFRAPDFENEGIACEVKKTNREVDILLQNVTKCCAGDHDPTCFDGGKRRNAHKKWVALQARKPRIFWAVGPSPTSRVFEVLTAADGGMRLHEVSHSRLRFGAAA